MSDKKDIVQRIQNLEVIYFNQLKQLIESV